MTVDAGRIERVEALVRAARVLVAPRGTFAPDDALVARMATASGLSLPSVRHALEHALEWRGTTEECAALVAGAGEPHDGPLAIVLSANVTTAALRALACAVARAEEVLVYPSSRDAVLAEAIVRGAALAGLSLVHDRDALPWADPHARFVLYGSAETARRVIARAHGPVEIHGPGLGIALLTDADAEDDAGAPAALAEDVAAFDQAGCLSPRLAVHVGTAAHGARIAERLHVALATLAEARPVGVLDDDARAARALFARNGQLLGRTWASDGGVVVHATEGPATPAPPARAIAVRTLPSLAEAEDWLAVLRPHLSALGARDTALREAFLEGIPLRRSDLGRMQRPAFDGPVDRRPHSAAHGPGAPKSG
jgi:hypothetical protein